jgi:hypothetical protein
LENLSSTAQVIHDSVNSQKLANSQLAEQYLRKGKSQKNGGTVTCIVGGAMVASGLIVAVTGSGSDSRSYSNSMGPGTALAVGGTVLFCTGLTIYLIGKKNEKKGKLVLSTSKTMIPLPQHSKNFSIGVAIDL